MQNKHGTVSQGEMDIMRATCIKHYKHFLSTSEPWTHLEGTVLGEHGNSCTCHSSDWHAGGAAGVG